MGSAPLLALCGLLARNCRPLGDAAKCEHRGICAPIDVFFRSFAIFLGLIMTRMGDFCATRGVKSA